MPVELWGPKEEGIFRISGRTSHLSRLRREFDSGEYSSLSLIMLLIVQAPTWIFESVTRQI